MRRIINIIVNETKNNMVLKLGICELFHPKIHGFDNCSTPDVLTHYIVRYSLENEEFMDEDNYEELCDDMELMKESYHNASTKLNDDGCVVKHYKHIMSHSKYPKIDIMDVIRLEPGEEDVAILKTCWLRIFQRKCKSYYKYKQALIAHHSRPNNIQYRETHGKWPLFHYKKDD